MLIKLISAKVTSLNNVDVTYLHISTDKEFTVPWDRDSYSERFELIFGCVYSEVEALDDLISEAIKTGETCALYLEIRDTFDSSDCETLEEEFQLKATAAHEFEMGGELTIETVEGTLSLQLPTTPDSQHSINSETIPRCNVEKIIEDIYATFKDETTARLSFALNTDVAFYIKYYDEQYNEYLFKAADFDGVVTLLRERGGSDYTVYEVCDGSRN